MNDRSTIYTREPTWTDIDRAALRTEEQKVLALLVLFTALVISGIWGMKVLERHVEGQQETISAGGIM
jgi:hypothetical protein